MKEAIMSLHSLPKMPNKLVNSPLQLMSFHERVPSVEQAPKLELKPLPIHFKYVCLGEVETLPVIIANDLTEVQEEKLLRILKQDNDWVDVGGHKRDQSFNLYAPNFT